MKDLLCLAMAFVLCGCTYVFSPRPDCEEVTALQSLVQQGLTESEFVVQITERYRLGPDDLLVDTYRDGSKGYTWKVPPVWYIAAVEDGVLNRVLILHTRWTIDQCITCFGAPETYRAEYSFSGPSRTSFRISVLMADRGIKGHGYEFHRMPPRMSQVEPRGSFPVYELLVFRQGAPAQVLQSIYGGDDRVLVRLLREYKPWPGRIEDVEVIIDPYIEEYWEKMGE